MKTPNEVLSASYMQVIVKLRIWQMSVKDKTITDDVTHDVGAKDGSVRVYKSLGNHKAAKAVKSAYTNIQRVWRRNTLPLHSGDAQQGGYRIAPVNDMTRVIKELEYAKHQAFLALDEFRAEYPNVVAWAQNDLGNAFDASDFPTVDEACARFYVDIDFETIPVNTTFDGMELPTQMVDWFKQRIEKRNEEKINNALNALREKLLEEVSRMATNLKKFSEYQEQEGKRAPQLYESLVTNVQHSLTMIRATAVGDTVKLNELADKIEEKLTTTPVKDLKKSQASAAVVAAAAQELADAIDEDEWTF